jgi:phosphatidylserine/phosphatidylglycerophosphate/cardiolipin synthase-like enzyme
MKVPELEDALRTTFLDRQLSRGEKQGLGRILQLTAADSHSQAVARSCAFKLARDFLQTSVVNNATSLEVIDWLEQVINTIATATTANDETDRSEAFFSPKDPCVNKIARMFDNAVHQADVCVFTITDDRIRRSIESAHQRGVQVRILSDNDKSVDLGSDLTYLQRLGIPTRVDRSEFHMHHKFALFDRRRLLTGSYNWTRSASENNEENFIVTSDPVLLRAFQQEFDRLWQAFG